MTAPSQANTTQPALAPALKLFPFQEVCVDKLTLVPSGLIGDDMGLGKTVEAIEIDRRKRTNHAAEFIDVWKGKPLTLVVAPNGVVLSWMRHFKRWNPKLKVYVVDRKDRSEFVRQVMKGSNDVYITHWEGLRLMPELQTVRWFHVIADEVHRAKNRKAQMTVALKKLRTDHKVGCSGTPADNRPDDFWSVLNWLYPRKFSSYWAFRNHHLLIRHHNVAGDCGCYQEHKRPFDEILGCANVEELQAEIEPFYVRRLKETVWEDMPEKYYTPVEVDLDPKQRRAYEDMRRTMLAWIGKHENEPIAAPMVIAQLTRLQQFAMAHARMEEKFIKRRKCKELDCMASGVCKGHWIDMVLLQEPSTKLDAAMDIIEDNPGKQIVCFSQSKQIMNMLAARLAKRDITCALYTGDTPSGDGPGERDRIVEEFQQGERRIFAGTIASGGEGIELTAADRVMFFDRAWSPSKNQQAEDRCHRFGQHNAVQVIDLIARGTIDRGRNQQINLKWSWLKEILGDAPPVRVE